MRVVITIIIAVILFAISKIQLILNITRDNMNIVLLNIKARLTY